MPTFLFCEETITDRTHNGPVFSIKPSTNNIALSTRTPADMPSIIRLHLVGNKVCSRTRRDVLLEALKAAFAETFGYIIARNEKHLHGDWDDAERTDFLGRCCLYPAWPHVWDATRTDAVALGLAHTVWGLLNRYDFPCGMKLSGASRSQVARWESSLRLQRSNALVVATAGSWTMPDPQGLRELYFLLTGEKIK